MTTKPSRRTLQGQKDPHKRLLFKPNNSTTAAPTTDPCRVVQEDNGRGRIDPIAPGAGMVVRCEERSPKRRGRSVLFLVVAGRSAEGGTAAAA